MIREYECEVEYKVPMTERIIVQATGELEAEDLAEDIFLERNPDADPMDFIILNIKEVD